MSRFIPSNIELLDRSYSPSKTSLRLSNGTSSIKQNTNIKVIVRFRPENESELCADHTNVIEYSSNDQVVSVGSGYNGPSMFTFDRIFSESSSQDDIFKYSIDQTTDDLSKGYNGTVFCYGQTGSGKSYTMMGDLEDEDKKGLIPRIFEKIFQIIEKSPKSVEYTVGVSYMEVYNESLKDLLNPKNNHKLAIHESSEGAAYVSNLEILYVANLSDVYEILFQGNKNRATGSTSMNSQSSRSHAIFQIKLTSKNPEEIKTGSLFLVDLAGSEKIDKTAATGQVLEEAKRINFSLSSLGNVIYSLTDGKSTHIPYRDSKLTRILQESLGGNSRTTLIINCSPSSYNEQETLSALRFGSRAKKITNVIHVNSELSTNELKKRYLNQITINEGNVRKIQKLSNENEKLKKENELLKSELERYKSKIELKNTPQEVNRLNETIISLKSSQKLMTDELLNRSTKIMELENKLLDKSDNDRKINALEKALQQFTAHIEQVEKQNLQLRKNIKSVEQISVLKTDKIDELQSQLDLRNELVCKDSEGFESKLNYLKSRLNTAKQAQTQTQTTAIPLPNNSVSSSRNSSSSSSCKLKHNTEFPEIVKNATNISGSIERSSTDELNEDQSSNTSQNSNDQQASLGFLSPDIKENPLRSGRIGLNLRIVKPMRGGADDE